MLSHITDVYVQDICDALGLKIIAKHTAYYNMAYYYLGIKTQSHMAYYYLVMFSKHVVATSAYVFDLTSHVNDMKLTIHFSITYHKRVITHTSV